MSDYSNRVNKYCEGCGSLMENVSPNRVFCAACNLRRRAERNKAYREKHQIDKKRKAERSSSDIVKKAPKTNIKKHSPDVAENRKACEGCFIGNLPI